MPDPVVMILALTGGVALSSVVVIVGHLLSRQGLAATGAVAVALGFLSGAWILGIRPSFPPREDLDRLFFILLPIAVGAEVGSVLLVRWRWAGWALRACVAFMAGRIILDGTIYITDVAGPGTREWSSTFETLILGGLAIALLIAWRMLIGRNENDASRWTGVVLSITIGATGLVIMLSGYATAGQLSFPLAGAIAGGLVLTRTRELPGLLSIGLVGLFALLMLGHFFGNLTPLNAALLFTAPVAAAVLHTVLIRRLRPWQRGSLQLAIGVVPLVIAVALAQHKFTHDANSTASTGEVKESSVDDYMSFGK